MNLSAFCAVQITFYYPEVMKMGKEGGKEKKEEEGRKEGRKKKAEKERRQKGAAQ